MWIRAMYIDGFTIRQGQGITVICESRWRQICYLYTVVVPASKVLEGKWGGGQDIFQEGKTLKKSWF